jgi:hypothetical protein
MFHVGNVGRAALAATAILLSAASAEAQRPSLQQRWERALNGSTIVHQFNTFDDEGRIDTSIENAYALCRNGTYVHTREEILGGSPPFFRSPGPGQRPLLPVGRWSVVVRDGGFGTSEAFLQLSSSNGAIKQFPLSYQSSTEILVNNADFFLSANDSADCGTSGEPFGDESPLQ